MKRLFLFLIIVLIPFVGFTQDLSTEKLIIPKDKFLAKELEKEIQDRIARNQSKILSIAQVISDLNNHKISFQNIGNSFFETISSFDSTNVGNQTKVEELILLENSMIEKIENFTFLERYFENPASRVDLFGLKIAQRQLINDFLISSPFLIKIQNRMYGSQNTINQPALKSKEDLEKFKEKINSNSFKVLSENLLKVWNSEISKQEEDLKKTEAQLSKDISDVKLLGQKINEEETRIDNLAIKIGLPLFCFTILLLFLGPKILGLLDKDSTVETKDISSQNVLLEISTVLLLTMSILILGLSGKINGDVLGTLIGGISGYVLNRIVTTNKGNTQSN